MTRWERAKGGKEEIIITTEVKGARRGTTKVSGNKYYNAKKA
jgi:hypothetical protein